MGLFNFNSYNQIEQGLLDIYSLMLTASGIDKEEAKKMIEDMLNTAIEQSKKGGNYFLPQNLGSIIVGEAETDDQGIQKYTQALRERMPQNEGISLDDIRMWWNLNDVERRMIQMQDMATKSTAMFGFLKSGMASSPEQAIAMVCKIHPVYGNPNDNSQSSGDDRPLPYELKDRINIYIQKRSVKVRKSTKKKWSSHPLSMPWFEKKLEMIIYDWWKNKHY